MLEQLENSKSLWGGKSQTVDNWLLSRQSLLVSYCELAGVNQHELSLPSVTKINAFCEQLMDYLSAGHFEVYDMLVGNDANGQALKDSVYPHLTQTTDAALQFNDAFAELLHPEQAESFDKSLASLGQTMETCFTMEDRLIAHMCASLPATNQA